MELKAVNNNMVVMVAPAEQRLNPQAIIEMVKTILNDQGYCLWGATEIDMFPSESETLIIARQAAGVHIGIVDYALPFIQKHT